MLYQVTVMSPYMCGQGVDSRPVSSRAGSARESPWPCEGHIKMKTGLTPVLRCHVMCGSVRGWVPACAGTTMWGARFIFMVMTALRCAQNELVLARAGGGGRVKRSGGSGRTSRWRIRGPGLFGVSGRGNGGTEGMRAAAVRRWRSGCRSGSSSRRTRARRRSGL